MDTNSMPLAPAYGYGRKRTESRRIEGPGRSEYIITHRHGSNYQKQSVFASAQPQRLPSRYNSLHGAHATPYYSAPPPASPAVVPAAFDREGPSRARMLPPIYPIQRSIRKEKEYTMSISSSGKTSSSDFSDMDQHSPRGLTFGISLARSNPDKNSSVSLTQTSEPKFGLDGVKESKKITEGDCKVYMESIFSVSSSRYTNSLDLRMPVEAELVLQPPPGPTEKSLSPLLTWT